MSAPLLELRGLGVSFPVGGGIRRQQLRAVHDVSFTLRRGEIVALVGESGSGKSTIARLIARLVPATSGEILIDGVDVLKSEPRAASRAFRKRVQMVFQDPFGSLNPVHTIVHHVERPLLIHGQATREDAREKAAALLEEVGLRPAGDYLDRHPYELSGGQRQRVAIARALASSPDLLMADEPTSMLDVSVRTEVLGLLRKLREDRGLAQLFITHDLAAARFLADRILVLYAGQIMAFAPAAALIDSPRHPYVQLLMAAIPQAGHALTTPLPARSGAPRTIDPPPGCPFAERCHQVHERCHRELPALHPIEGDRSVRCHLYDPQGTS